MGGRGKSLFPGFGVRGSGGGLPSPKPTPPGPASEHREQAARPTAVGIGEIITYRGPFSCWFYLGKMKKVSNAQLGCRSGRDRQAHVLLVGIQFRQLLEGGFGRICYSFEYTCPLTLVPETSSIWPAAWQRVGRLNQCIDEYVHGQGRTRG